MSNYRPIKPTPFRQKLAISLSYRNRCEYSSDELQYEAILPAGDVNGEMGAKAALDAEWWIVFTWLVAVLKYVAFICRCQVSRVPFEPWTRMWRFKLPDWEKLKINRITLVIKRIHWWCASLFDWLVVRLDTRYNTFYLFLCSCWTKRKKKLSW